MNKKIKVITPVIVGIILLSIFIIGIINGLLIDKMSGLVGILWAICLPLGLLSFVIWAILSNEYHSITDKRL